MRFERVLSFAIVTFGLVAPALAQPVLHPEEVAAPPRAEVLGVEVLAPGGELDAVATRIAIARELGVDVADASEFAPSLGRLEIAVDRGEVRIAYHPAAGTVIERTLALPIAADERLQLVAFVATNLVRDQTSDILANLPPIAIPPIAAPPPREPPPRTIRIAATLGFVPPLAIDRAIGTNVVVGAGLHVLVGATDGSEYVSISGIADRQRRFASGAQLAGVVASAGQLAGGVQIGGVLAQVDGDAHGVQLGGAGAVARRVRGAQIGGAATYARDVRGLQLAGAAAVATGEVRGVQIAGAAAVASRVHGLQLATANVGGDVEGAQIGVINVARRMRGLQLGVVNLSDDGADSIPIGLINYSKNGPLTLDGWVESSRLSAVAFRHGTRRVHNVWSFAWSPDHDHVLVGAGLGVRAALGSSSAPAVDLDAMSWLTNVWNGDLGQLEQLRISLAVPFAGFEVFGGVAANVYVSDEMDDSASFHPVLARQTTTDGGTRVVAWPSAFVGLRLRAR